VHSIFLEGLAVGFCLAAPVGPIAVLCLQRTTAEGKLAGIATGLGAALADAFYGTLAALGITAVSSFLAEHRDIMLRLGGLVLIVLGTRLLLAKATQSRAESDGAGLVRDFLSSLALTLTNPMTFVAFAAVFAALGIHAGRHQPLMTLELVLGVFTGSLAWWLVLVALATLLRGRIRDSALVWVDRAVGALVILVGVLYVSGVAGALVRARFPSGSP
jgi:threonine/homoserine/homoserine lactone efflux protein